MGLGVFVGVSVGAGVLVDVAVRVGASVGDGVSDGLDVLDGVDAANGVALDAVAGVPVGVTVTGTRDSSTRAPTKRAMSTTAVAMIHNRPAPPITALTRSKNPAPPDASFGLPTDAVGWNSVATSSELRKRPFSLFTDSLSPATMDLPSAPEPDLRVPGTTEPPTTVGAPLIATGTGVATDTPDLTSAAWKPRTISCALR